MNYKYIFQSLFIAILVSSATECLAQRIENVQPEIVGNKIHVYYDLLDITEAKLRQDDPFVAKIKNDAKRIIENCRIKFK